MSDVEQLRSIAQQIAAWTFSTAHALLGSAAGLRVDLPFVDGALVLLIHIPSAGRGRVIGKHGRTVMALETVAQAIAGRAGATLPITLKVLGAASCREASWSSENSVRQ